MSGMLVGAFGIAFVFSLLACALAYRLFPWFRSGEHKQGNFRPDKSASGGVQVSVRKGKAGQRAVRVRSSELPLVGGLAMLLALAVAAVAASVLLPLPASGWVLLAILLLATLGYGAVGYLDDSLKVHRGNGLTEWQKLLGVAFVSLVAAVALNRFIITDHLSARFAYPPYSEVPLLGSVLQHTHFAWIAFFLIMTVTVATATSLATDFSDGMDGLSGGLLLSASLAFAAILVNQSFGMRDGSDLWPLIVLLLALAGAVAGYLPFNWPSSWRARSGAMGRRRARLIMGDSGSLALGGLLALVAVISRMELLLLIIGGVFVLEGLSALISARVLVKFFRRTLYLERYQSSRGFHHTEFPLPFLATPLHHHFDLLHWDRRRLVYSAWFLGAVLGALGVASTIAPLTWERYLARFLGLLVVAVVWQSGSWTRSFFLGLSRKPDGSEWVGLFYGYPFRLLGQRLYRCVTTTELAASALRTPAERLTLWQRMSVFDARALLGYYCYRAGLMEDADRVWDRIPDDNLRVRPEIKEMAEHARREVGIAAATAPAQVLPPATSAASAPPADQPEDERARSAWRFPVPSVHAVEPPTEPPSTTGAVPDDHLWSASRWTAATAPTDPRQPAVPSTPLADAAAPTDPPTPAEDESTSLHSAESSARLRRPF